MDTKITILKEEKFDNQVTFDLHTHTLASGHGSMDTIAQLAKEAKKRQLSALGISDHGPAYLGSCHESYFRALSMSQRVRFEVPIYYGVELNILDTEGRVDLPPSILSTLDYAIISLHKATFYPKAKPDFYTKELCTNAYLNALAHPNVKIIGHVNDPAFPIDANTLFYAALDNHVVFEINEASVAPAPRGYRKCDFDLLKEILELSKENGYPVLLSSDSHGKEHIGDFKYTLKFLEEVDFPSSLIISDLHFLA